MLSEAASISQFYLIGNAKCAWYRLEVAHQRARTADLATGKERSDIRAKAVLSVRAAHPCTYTQTRPR